MKEEKRESKIVTMTENYLQELVEKAVTKATERAEKSIENLSKTMEKESKELEKD